MMLSYGYNPKSGRNIHIDRREEDCASLGVFGLSGTGKTYFLKRDIMKSMGSTDDIVFVVKYSEKVFYDDSEYMDLINLYEGKLFKIIPGQTSVNSITLPNNTRLIVIDIEHSEDDLFHEYYSSCLEKIWEMVTKFKGSRTTHIYLDGIDAFSHDENVLIAITSIAKRSKHYKSMLTYTAQDATRIYDASFGKELFDERTRYVLFLSQFKNDTKLIQSIFKIPPSVASYFINQPIAQGLLVDLNHDKYIPLKFKF